MGRADEMIARLGKQAVVSRTLFRRDSQKANQETRFQ
jgi:hypothetical protein